MPGDPSSNEVQTALAQETAASYPEVAEILRRAHAGLEADTATVLLLDETRSVLVPAATIGLDKTLRGARRVPMGLGFAGVVAQTRQPVVLSDVSRSTVVNPVLLDHGVRTLLGVPIVDGSELLGVLHVGFLRGHDFGELEVMRLTEFALELGEVLRDRFSDAEHTTALTLQRSLLPTTPQAPPGLAIAARYVPAEGDLGGDWYDVFQLPGGALGLVMGDVIGHGLAAAIVMGRLRSALRAYAIEHEDPAEVLQRLDREICHFESDVLATVLYGVAEPPFATWRFSSAGHYAPVVGAPDVPGVVAEVPSDPLLGLHPGTQRLTHVVEVPDGGLLCLFTDGLVERRPGPEDGASDLIGINLARVGLALAEADDPELGCIRVLGEVLGEHVADDDIAILVAQRQS
ncbi:MAG: SpoIIE family protein phosphatase [Nocardioides sp.]|uniref:PP2C family protein-serine/threonine phosphatase n=1 Tax=Nocardioides sp. TaxID=35761 RepID=UPI0039E534BD